MSAAGLLTRTWVVAEATFRGTFAGYSWLGLLAAAAAYPLLVLAIAASSIPGVDLLGVAETFFSAFFLPVILLLVCLIVGVGLFRTELEEDTLLYPMNRTVERPVFVAGKFLGGAAATNFVLVPSAVLGTAIAAALGHGSTPDGPGLLDAVLLVTVLGSLTYGATFLWLGLVTRQALVIGLLYGFIWETFISVIGGPIHQLTVVHYLRTIAAELAPGGPLLSGSTSLSIAECAAGLLGSSAIFLGVAAGWLRYQETLGGRP